MGGEGKWGQVLEGSPGQQANFGIQRWENSQPTGSNPCRSVVRYTHASQPDQPQGQGIQDLGKVQF